jgi:hypothetical protein
MKNEKTDTPRTDAARERYYDGKTSDWVHYTICRMIEQELAISLENQCKAQAEVERLKAQLSRAVTIGEALSSELVFPAFVNELNSLKASLSETNSLQPSA